MPSYVVAGAGTSACDGTYDENGTYASQPAYQDPVSTYWIAWNPGFSKWMICANPGSTVFYLNPTITGDPWATVVAGSSPAPTVSEAEETVEGVTDWYDPFAAAGDDGSGNIGTNWANEANVYTEDLNSASVGVNSGGGAYYTDAIDVTDFRIGLPAGATPVGLQVRIDDSTTGSSNWYAYAKFIVAGSAVGDTLTGDPFSLGYEVLGALDDMAGTSAAFSDIHNQSDFGVRIWYNAAQVGSGTIYVDNVQIRVAYTRGGGGQGGVPAGSSIGMWI